MDLTQALAAARRDDLQGDARRRTLAALARCCQPSTWAKAARRLAATLNRRTRPTPAACCA